jgi:hypothetical protein
MRRARVENGSAEGALNAAWDDHHRARDTVE